MSQSPELESQILRFSQGEKLRVNTIAHRLGVHHTVVRRVLAQASLLTLEPRSRPSEIGTYLPVIRQTLENFPRSPQAVFTERWLTAAIMVARIICAI